MNTKSEFWIITYVYFNEETGVERIGNKAWEGRVANWLLRHADYNLRFVSAHPIYSDEYARLSE